MIFGAARLIVVSLVFCGCRMHQLFEIVNHCLLSLSGVDEGVTSLSRIVRAGREVDSEAFSQVFYEVRVDRRKPVRGSGATS